MFAPINRLYISILNDKNLEKTIKKDIYYKDTIDDNLYHEIIKIGKISKYRNKNVAVNLGFKTLLLFSFITYLIHQ